MGPPENPTNPLQNQETTPSKGRKRPRRRPRTRRCLLKGCEQRFRPQQARQRYCGERCREAAREWSRWKAQERYRATIPETRPEPETVRERGGSGGREGNHSKLFSRAAATGRAATSGSRAAGDRHSGGSVPRSADTPWSVSGSGSDAGKRRGQNPEGGAHSPQGREVAARSVGSMRQRDKRNLLTACSGFK